MNVQDMKWDDMKGLVERRLNKLAMCKRGTLQTEVNERKKALGDEPRYTKEERAKIDKSLAAEAKKALTPTTAEIRKCLAEAEKYGQQLPHALAGLGSTKLQAFTKKHKDRYVHPKRNAWRTAMEKLQQEHKEREATLDGDFQDEMDAFLVGEYTIQEFPARYQALEAREW